MKPSLRPDTITLDDFRDVLSRYHEHVAATDAAPLEQQRWKVIPESLAERRKNHDAYLEKDEVLTLVDWRRKHALPPPEEPPVVPGFVTAPPDNPLRTADLIELNSEELIRDATRELFSTYEKDRSQPGTAIADLVVRNPAYGFGAPTATLLLSCYDPENIPFFADEGYRYVLWRNKFRSRWDRKLKYEIRSWKRLYGKAHDLRKRLGEENVSAAEIEKVAYVIAKEDDGKHDYDDEEGPKRKRRKQQVSRGYMDTTESDLEDFSNRASDICKRKGPKGSPTYDDLGYEQDYSLCARTGGRPKPLSNRALNRLEEKRKEGERKAQIVVEGPGGSGYPAENAWDDRVARDLRKPYHTVTVEDYEEWKRRGFKMEKWVYDHTKMDKEEKDRLFELSCGSAFRKGSVRG